MIIDCDFLTIDDLGTEVTSSFAASQLFHVLNERIAKNRSTIISTNMTPEEFSAVYSQRIYSRLLSHYKFIKLVGTDIRIQKKLRGGIT
jgi:DNA replication protein DnaC